MQKLETVIPSGYVTNLDDFSASIEEESVSFRPLGDLIHSFQKFGAFRGIKGEAKAVNGQCTAKTYEIYVADGKVSKFPEYLRNMESFILWFIDAASTLDPEDERWKFYVM